MPGTCAACSYDGEPYQAGDAFPATDGCNTCSCGADGVVAVCDVLVVHSD